MSTHKLDVSANVSVGSNIRLTVVNKRQAEDLADFVRRVRAEKGLSLNDVEVRSGGTISKGYVGHIENRHVLGSAVTAQKLFALAKGLGVSEDEVLAAVRNKAPGQLESPAEFGILFYGWEEATEEQKAETLTAIRMIAESFQRRRERAPQKSKGSNGTGKKKK